MGMRHKDIAIVTAPPADLDRARAVHEAGHCVAAIKLGIGVQYATLRNFSNQDRAGMMTKIPPVLDANTLCKAAKVSLAGGVAEGRHLKLLTGQRTFFWRLDAWHTDWEKVERRTAEAMRLQREPLAEQRELIDRLEMETSTLIDANWASVERVAEALLKRRRLSGDEIEQLIF